VAHSKPAASLSFGSALMRLNFLEVWACSNIIDGFLIDRQHFTCLRHKFDSSPRKFRMAAMAARFAIIGILRFA
jgi:hypothetical protein